MSKLTQHPAVVEAAKKLHCRLIHGSRYFAYEPEWQDIFSAIIATAVEKVVEPYEKACEAASKADPYGGDHDLWMPLVEAALYPKEVS